jgi:hypothetical protein
VATAAEIAKTRLPKGAVGFAVCFPFEKARFKRDSGQGEVVVFEPGDSLADAREALVGAGFDRAAVASLSPKLAPTTKARHGARHPETGRFRAKRTGLWEHGGGVLPSLLTDK